MKRGLVYWINLEDTHPPEFGKTRPAIIVSNSEQNAVLPTLVVVPVSSQAPQIWPLRLEFQLEKKKKSYAVIPGIRQIHKQRLLDMMGRVTPAFLRDLDEAIQMYLSDG